MATPVVPPDQVPTCITARAVATTLGCSLSFIERIRQEGSGPPFVRIGGRRGRILYPLAALREWIAAQTQGGPSHRDPSESQPDANANVPPSPTPEPVPDVGPAVPAESPAEDGTGSKSGRKVARWGRSRWGDGSVCSGSASKSKGKDGGPR